MSQFRKATAIWTGRLKDGSGKVSGESRAFQDLAYSAHSRFETKDGAGSRQTNPEELIAAAHASCFSMAVSHGLEEAGMDPRSLDVTAAVSLTKGADGWAIPSVHLILHAHVPGANDGDFRDVVQRAKETCPVSRLLNASISWEAHLNTESPKSLHYDEMKARENRPI